MQAQGDVRLTQPSVRLTWRKAALRGGVAATSAACIRHCAQHGWQREPVSMKHTDSEAAGAAPTSEAMSKQEHGGGASMQASTILAHEVGGPFSTRQAALNSRPNS